MHNSENVQRHYVRKFLMVIQLKNYVSFLFRNDSAWRYLGEHIFWNIKYVFYILSWSNQLVSPERKSSIKKEKLVYRLKNAEKDFLKMMRFPVILCTFSLFRVGIFYWTPLGIYYFIVIYKTLVWKLCFLCIYETFFARGDTFFVYLKLSFKKM